MEIKWKDISVEDKTEITNYYEEQQSKSCEATFANNYLWAPHYDVQFAIIDNFLVSRSLKGHEAVSFPAGAGDAKAVIEKLMTYFEEISKPFCIYSVTPDQFANLEQWFPGIFQIEYDRDSADYVYETEKLITLSGKKLHSKRNHLNRFKEMYPNWSYEKITKENKEECISMAYEWKEQNHCEEHDEKHKEFCVTIRALKEMEALELAGGLIRIEGKVVAFALGEKCSDDTFVVHIEKAFAEIQGAYPIINQQMAEHEGQNYTYINREEDTGEEGLRKAKLSYKPVFLIEKGIVTMK